ncbi:MAG: biotin--[acetyl-CoA-carboxylase] ligase [Spirochaetaceae bacterium]|nr:biotin--[acetyl-CoA-carboxylase] ligase [Spirochaetaceae bacterium]
MNGLCLTSVRSPFDGPVYRIERTGSTMEDAKRFADEGAPDGTVIVADYQERGRGRFAERLWVSEAGESLLFTIFFRYNDFSHIPEALTLRTGLAVSEAVDGFIKPEKTAVKWPNDVMAGKKKLAGILTEGVSNTVFIGVGVNVFQRHFPANQGTGRMNAASIALVKPEPEVPEGASGFGAEDQVAARDATRFLLLEKILAELDGELNTESRVFAWRERLEKRLFMRGREVVFAPGGRGTENMVRGVVKGIGGGGELLVQTASGEETFISGEIRL